MKLPEIADAQAYAGLYVFDFGEWTALGYTAEEIAVLLEEQRYADGQVYRIRRATPDGRFELMGVSRARFSLESGMFFPRMTLEDARADFDALRAAAHAHAPPCRAKLQLTDRSRSGASAPFVTALIYPAEYDDDVARWLLDVNYAGGDVAEGGVSHVTDYQQEDHRILDRAQLWAQRTRAAREREEVLATVQRAVQR